MVVLPEPWRPTIRIGTGAAAATSFTWESYEFKEMATGLVVIPIWIPQSTFAIGCWLLLVALIDELIGVLRGMQLKKLPSVAETIDWGRTLLALGMNDVNDNAVRATLGVVLKHQADHQRASAELKLA